MFYLTIPFEPIKEILPIKILFSPKTGIEKKIKELLIEYLGPIGGSEFSILRNRGLDEESVKDYTDMIIKKEILSKEKAELLEESIALVFKGEEVKVGLKDLKKTGLLKRKKKSQKKNSQKHLFLFLKKR